jgi:hypothetical protein
MISTSTFETLASGLIVAVGMLILVIQLLVLDNLARIDEESNIEEQACKVTQVERRGVERGNREI